MSWYKIGTIAATNGSKIITGTGTQFTNPLNGVSAGRMLLLPAAGTVQIYEIESVQSDTQLTLVSAFTGTTGTGKAYAIPTSPAVSIEQFAHEFASTLAYYQQQLSGWQQILTGTGNVTLTTPDGQAVTVRSQQAWDVALDGKVTGVKQTGAFDATAGSLLINGAWGWGGSGQLSGITSDTDLLTYLRGANTPSSVLRLQYNSTYAKQNAASIYTRVNDMWSLISVGPHGSAGNSANGVRMSAGTTSGGQTVTYDVWTDKNLIKQTGVNDTTPGSMLLNGAHGLGRSQSAGISMPTILDGNNSVTAGFVEPASATNWYYQFSPAVVAFRAGGADGTGQIMQVQVGPSGELAARHRTNNVWTTWAAHMTLSTAQTITAIKTHTAAVVVSNAVAFRGTLTGGNVRNLAHINASNVVRLGDAAAPTTIHGSAMPLVQVGSGENYEIVDSGTIQTITGAKTFAQSPTITAGNHNTVLDDSNVATGTVGRTFRITNNAGVLRIFRDPSLSSTTGRTYISFSTAATGIALVSGNNAVADSNGFWKTASPVVKLFADGTSELTSEAEGITTERLSEGVYRISGCLGLNADRTWGGDEGSEQINPDGSIIIRTYHRPHPDAPAFARNEIGGGGCANGEPIDIPRDTFISVRGQMPKREEPKPKMMHSNVYCNTVAS
ncbi:hypothetical protein [Candidatus Symbiopectobacterium endolongispinus]|uniref:phage tail fiber protein n=1 Tax=Candidatus Symbiopectobacterium endolongispinus TaxID=2812664 RepID=UPI00207AB39E|nr:hypothetical protein [Candidatus Symbiopectobacterium endolongispinus]MBT9429099.1 hypothetical protein [Candidatus Symbiopectobacterium endolongispinus]